MCKTRPRRAFYVQPPWCVPWLICRLAVWSWEIQSASLILIWKLQACTTTMVSTTAPNTTWSHKGYSGRVPMRDLKGWKKSPPPTRKQRDAGLWTSHTYDSALRLPFRIRHPGKYQDSSQTYWLRILQGMGTGTSTFRKLPRKSWSSRCWRSRIWANPSCHLIFVCARVCACVHACVCVCVCMLSRSVVFDSLWPFGL